MPDSPGSPLPTEQPPTREMPASEGSRPYHGESSIAEKSFGAPLSPGDIGTLGRYRVLRRLGKGGMGAVYLGQDDRLKRKVALKIMLPQLAADPRSRARFLREARTACQLDHENLVKLYDVDEVRGTLFIVMQFLQGTTLDEYLKQNGPPTVEQILRIGRETAAALAAAHRAGLVHRDIKPGNIWLEAPHGRVKVLDFGLVKTSDYDEDSSTELTHTGAVVGTPSYMSPEQGRGLPIDHRSDLFSLGSVLYRLSTGRLPFQGRNSMAILTALAVDDPPHVALFNADLPQSLADLIHALLEKSPAARPTTADVVLATIRTIEAERKFVGDNGETVVDTPKYVALPVEAEANEFAEIVSNREATPQVSTEKRKSSAAKYATIGTLAALAIGGPAVYFLTGSRERSPEKVEVKPAEPKPRPVPTKTFVPATKFPPLSPEFAKSIKDLAPDEQVKRIVADLVKRNPQFEGQNVRFAAHPNSNTVKSFDILSTKVADLSPIQALTELESLTVGTGLLDDTSPLEDLEPLAGLKRLSRLGLYGHGSLADLAPLRKLPLQFLGLTHSRVRDIAALKGMPLEELAIYLTDVTDLAPLKGSKTLTNLVIGLNLTDDIADLAPLAGVPVETLIVHRNRILDISPLKTTKLKVLHWSNSPIPNLEPLRGQPLEELVLDEPGRHAEFLHSAKVRRIGQPGPNYKTEIYPADQYWAKFETRKREEDAFVARVAKLSVQETIAAVREHMKKLNGDLMIETTVKDGQVVGVAITGEKYCCDLSPLRAFTSLKEFGIGTGDSYILFGPLSELPIEKVNAHGNGRIVWLNRPALRDMKQLKWIDGRPAKEVLDGYEKPSRP